MLTIKTARCRRCASEAKNYKLNTTEHFGLVSDHQGYNSVRDRKLFYQLSCSKSRNNCIQIAPFSKTVQINKSCTVAQQSAIGHFRSFCFLSFWGKGQPAA